MPEVCHLRGKTHVGAACILEAGSIIVDSTIGNRVHVRPYSIIQESTVAEEAVVGPMAHLRSGSILGKGVLAGNFVEIKNSRIGETSKAAHLTYLGDSEIGKDVNIGCGTITCNYDGAEKHKTIIENGAFIGSDTQLIAPVKVGKNAHIGSGSTITEDVPPESLAVGRAQQKIVQGWAKQNKKKKKG